MDYHREPGCSDLYLFFSRSGEWSNPSYAPRLQLVTVHLFKLRIIKNGTDLFFYHCPLWSVATLGKLQAWGR